MEQTFRIKSNRKSRMTSLELLGMLEDSDSKTEWEIEEKTKK
jgi:hypothetical protein